MRFSPKYVKGELVLFYDSLMPRVSFPYLMRVEEVSLGRSGLLSFGWNYKGRYVELAFSRDSGSRMVVFSDEVKDVCEVPEGELRPLTVKAVNLEKGLPRELVN